MKKILFTLLCIIFLLSLCACHSSQSGNSETKTDNTESSSSAVMQTVLNPSEYVLYLNIFNNGQGKDYEGKQVTKTGTFATIIDKYNNRTRYYVWGYNDNTKCCDWQWELNITDTSNLPSNGSLVEATGNFAASDESLDGYWIENPTIKVNAAYTGPACEVDMTTMSATLERVQLINIQQHPDDFEGKTIYSYGRVYDLTSIQHPYYDNVWVQSFETTDTIPAIGTCVIVNGTFSDGVLKNSNIKETDLF